MALNFSFIKPDYTALTDTAGTYEGEFAIAVYTYKMTDTRYVYLYKGTAPTEAEFKTFDPTVNRTTDALAMFTLAPADMSNPMTATNVRSDSNWNNELNVYKTVNATATGTATWAIYGSGNEWFMIPQIGVVTDTTPSPVILDNLSLTSGSPTTLKNLTLFINPYASGLWG